MTEFIIVILFIGDNMDVLEQLRKHEGLRLKVYQCSMQRLTIGYGRNLEETGLSQDEAEFLLKNDVAFIQDQLTNRLPYFCNLQEERQAVLINLAFNVGISGLMRFKKTLAAVEKCDYALAAQEMLNSKWAKQVGNRAVELSRQMETCEWQK